MPGEVELERMVVRITGDTAGVQRAYDQTAKGSKELAAKIARDTGGRGVKLPVSDVLPQLKDTGEAMDGVHLKARGLYMGLRQLTGVAGISPQVSQSAMVLSRALPALGGYAAPILAVAAPLAVVGAAAHRLYQEWDRSRQAANAAFQTVATGARTANQAVADVRVSLMTEGFKHLTEIANPSLVQFFQTGLQQAARPSVVRGLYDHLMGNRTPQEIAASISDPVDAGARQIEIRVRRATEMLRALNTRPSLRRLQGQLVSEQTQQQARDQATVMEDQANAAGLAGVASQQYAMAARLARAQNEDGIVTAQGLAAAYQQLRKEFERMTAAGRQQALTEFRVGPLRNAQNQVELAGLGADAAQRLGYAQQFAAQNSISVNKALQLLNPMLAQMATLQDRAARRTFDATQVRQLEEEADRAGLSENAARRLGMAQQFAFDRGISLGEALDRLSGSLNRVQDAQNRAAMGNFLRDVRMQGATMGLSSERARLFQMSLDGVSDANITAALAEVRHLEALRALQAGLEEIQGNRFGSTAALQNIAQYENRFTAAAQQAAIRQRLLQDQQLNATFPGGFGVLAGSTAAAQSATVTQAQQTIGQIGQTVPAAQAPAGNSLAAQIASALQQVQQQAQQQAAQQFQQVFQPLSGLLTTLTNWLQANQPAPVVGGGGGP